MKKYILHILICCFIVTLYACNNNIEDISIQSYEENAIGTDSIVVPDLETIFKMYNIDPATTRSATNHQIRFGILGTNTLSVSILNLQAHIASPNGGTIYYGAHYVGAPTGVVVNPLFVTNDNMTYIQFQLTHACQCVPPNHKLIITNSLGYDKTISLNSQNSYMFSDMVPLNPNGGVTVFTIHLYSVIS